MPILKYSYYAKQYAYSNKPPCQVKNLNNPLPSIRPPSAIKPHFHITKLTITPGDKSRTYEKFRVAEVTLQKQLRWTFEIEQEPGTGLR